MSNIHFFFNVVVPVVINVKMGKKKRTEQNERQKGTNNFSFDLNGVNLQNNATIDCDLEFMKNEKLLSFFFIFFG